MKAIRHQQRRGRGWALLVIALATTAASAQNTARLSVDSTGGQRFWNSQYPSVSSDGRIVAFQSKSDLVPDDKNGTLDIFVHDRATRITERVSVDSLGTEAAGASYWPSVSADGRFVAFSSTASNLVAGDGNGKKDIFVHDRLTGLTERVSVDSNGNEGNGDSDFPAISATGDAVALFSAASNLIPGDSNGNLDVFVHERTSGITERVSVDSSGNQSDGDVSLNLFVYTPIVISADGRIVVFQSLSSNLVAVDNNFAYDIFAHDRLTKITERISIRTDGNQGNSDSLFPTVSSSGDVVAFSSYASNLVVGDTNGFGDVFVHERFRGTTERISVDSSGGEANNMSFSASIAAGGQFVTFATDATNLVSNDTNASSDVFVHDRSTGITERVSVDSSGAEANGNSYVPVISGDGLVVAFNSDASNLVPGDTNNCADVFVHGDCLASWWNYGVGFPGTNGIPSFTLHQVPFLGSTTRVDISNSLQNWTVAMLVAGLTPASIATSAGGTLLVEIELTQLLALTPSGTSIPMTIPDDEALCGVPIYLQTIELDPGAAHHLSFTAGLEVLLGH